MKNQRQLSYFTFVVVLAMLLACGAFLACEIDPGNFTHSEPIPADGTVFVGGYRDFDGNAIVVVVYDDAIYIGYKKQKGGGGYATFQDRFSRLTLTFDGQIYRVTNASSLWASAWMHGAYPRGLIFNEDGTMSWISPISFSGYKGHSITLDGIRWPVSHFTRLDNVEVDKLEDSPSNLRINDNILFFDSLHKKVFVEQTGENVLFGFGENPIDLTRWNFSNPGNFVFRLRSLGGYPIYDEDGNLKKLIVSSGLSSSYASLVIALGEQVATPTNLRITERPYNPGFLDIQWDPVPNATSYRVGGFGNSGTWASVGALPNSGHHNPLRVGNHTLTVVAHRSRDVVNGVMTFFPSSEPATLILTIYRNGTFSYSN